MKYGPLQYSSILKHKITRKSAEHRFSWHFDVRTLHLLSSIHSKANIMAGSWKPVWKVTAWEEEDREVYQKKKKPSDVSKPDLTQRITCSSYSMRTVRVFSVQEVKIRVRGREGRAGSRSSQWHGESPVSWCQSTSASGGPSADEMNIFVFQLPREHVCTVWLLFKNEKTFYSI